jgi:hypothetical protein
MHPGVEKVKTHGQKIVAKRGRSVDKVLFQFRWERSGTHTCMMQLAGRR